MLKALDIRIGNALADLCDYMADTYADWARNLRRCPRCGRNMYYGEGCR